MVRDILISYLERGRIDESSGIRVREDGQAEMKYGDQDWKIVARLSQKQMKQLEDHIRTSNIFETPNEIPAPAGLYDSNSCEWHATLDGKHARVMVFGWSDSNPAAQHFRILSGQMYRLISAAQMGKIE
jgi:hypothetical protein